MLLDISPYYVCVSHQKHFCAVPFITDIFFLCSDSSTDRMLQHFHWGERVLLKTCPLVCFWTWPTVNHPLVMFAFLPKEQVAYTHAIWRKSSNCWRDFLSLYTTNIFAEFTKHSSKQGQSLLFLWVNRNAYCMLLLVLIFLACILEGVSLPTHPGKCT